MSDYYLTKSQREELDEFNLDHPALKSSVSVIHGWDGKPAILTLLVSAEDEFVPAMAQRSYSVKIVEEKGLRSLLEDLALELDPVGNLRSVKQSFLKYSDDMRGYLIGLEKRIADLEMEVVRLRGMV